MPPEPTKDPQEDDIDESVRVLMQGLPAPVREYVSGNKPDAVVLELTRKYQLHADQAGKLHQALLMMLLGVYTPERFANTLEDGGFSEDTTEGLLTDINERVFVPLRKAEREAEKEASPAPTPVPARKPLADVPAPLAVPAKPPLPQQPLPARPAPAAIPVTPVGPPVSVIPAPPPAVPVPPPVPSVIPAEPVMRTMAHDVETMSGSGMPAPFTPVPQAPPPAPVAPGPQTPQVPPTWAAPVTAPRVETPPPHPTRAIGAPDPQEVADTLKKYGIDPYREPTE